MGDNVNTYGDISPRTAAYVVADLLKRGVYLMVTERFGQSKPLPQKSTRTMKFRRYEALSIPTAPLAEGVPPDGQKLTKTDIQCTLEQEGDYIEITDVIQDTHEDPIMQESKDLLTQQYAETLESRRVAVLKAGTSVYYANGTTRAGLNSFFTRGQLRKIVRALKANKAKFFTQILGATAKYATEPVGPCFWAMGSTDLESDIRDLPGFVPIEKYSDSEKAIPGEVGKVENIRFVLTPLFESWGHAGLAVGADGKISDNATNNDVYPVIIVAPDSYAIVPMKGKNALDLKVVNPEQPSKSDPLGQRGSIGWKTWHTAVILNDNWIARIECCATANPA